MRRGLLCAAAIAGAFVAPGSALAAGYAAHLQEYYSTGAAGAHPDVSLSVTFDDGNGGKTDQPTGVLGFGLGTRHFSPTALGELSATGAGAVIGEAESDLADVNGVNTPLAITVGSGTVVDPVTGIGAIPAAIALPPTFSTLLGTDKLPIFIERSLSPLDGKTQQYAALVYLTTANKALAAQGLKLAFGKLRLTFYGTYAAGGSNHFLTTNPAASTPLTNAIVARGCPV